MINNDRFFLSRTRTFTVCERRTKHPKRFWMGASVGIFPLADQTFTSNPSFTVRIKVHIFCSMPFLTDKQNPCLDVMPLSWNFLDYAMTVAQNYAEYIQNSVLHPLVYHMCISIEIWLNCLCLFCTTF